MHDFRGSRQAQSIATEFREKIDSTCVNEKRKKLQVRGPMFPMPRNKHEGGPKHNRSSDQQHPLDVAFVEEAIQEAFDCGARTRRLRDRLRDRLRSWQRWLGDVLLEGGRIVRRGSWHGRNPCRNRSRFHSRRVHIQKPYRSPQSRAGTKRKPFASIDLSGLEKNR